MKVTLNQAVKACLQQETCFRIAVLFLALLGAAPAKAQPLAYVVNNGSNSVSVIDTQTNLIGPVIPIGAGFNSYAIAITPPSGNCPFPYSGNGYCAYVTNRSNDTYSVIDTASNLVSAGPISSGPPCTPPVLNDPTGAAVTPIGSCPAAGNGTCLFVANHGSGPLSYVSVFDTSNNACITNIVVGFGSYSGPFRIKITGACPLSGVPTCAVVTNQNENSLSVIDVATLTVVANMYIEISPFDVAIRSDGQYAYITHSSFAPGFVSIIDLSVPALAGAYGGLGNNPRGAAVTPDALGNPCPFSLGTGTCLYTANNGSSDGSVVDTTTAAVYLTPPLGSDPEYVALTPATAVNCPNSAVGTCAYFTNNGSNWVTVIDTTSNGYQVGINPISLLPETGPVDIAIAPF